MSYSFQDDFDKSQQDAESTFNNFAEQVNSTMKWGLTESIVMGVVITVAIVAIVYAIIDCLKKAGSAIPEYARISTSDKIDKASTEHVAITVTEPEFPVIRDSQVQYATMERFLSNIAREKPIRFSPQQIQEFTSNCSNLLGSGAYGVVFKGELPNGVPVAVKVLTNHSNNKKVEEQFMAEVGTIGRTYHANLVRLYGFCFDPSLMALVYEYMENGSLNKLLFNEMREIEWQKLHEIAIGTAKGIAYLHEDCQQRIIHYDIKPENILLDNSLNPKVADFGLAKLCNRESNEVTLSGGRGTLGYSAPEVWNRSHPVTHKCDVYSFGILLFEIVGRRRHFDDNLNESRQWLPKWTWDMYKNNELELMLSLCGIEQKDKEKAERMVVVALQCIQHSPDARPLMSDVVKMLEGSMEVLQQPQNPFDYLESNRLNIAFFTGSDEDSSTQSSALTRHISEPAYLVTRHEMEIELAATS
ncbi:hypothetical protein P3X46_022626 [Hevea brasiliensis]|uniref:Protein kinase domain-containing protein n=1 Tax=Hevea brasiliensis TaxID=3981 RepID=A0ABQ9LA92_HEVBR|nr:rust resistance kinase Lr10 [Hevea brasiliensis]KAJ9162886.1 hypothetical protein P3X46_022626 [Hevea brasiliensis]